MNKTWFSYVVLSVGLMFLVASDDQTTADDKKSAYSVNFGSEQQMEVLINRDGDSDAKVEIIIDGKKHSFTLPELDEDGKAQFITAEDGQEIKVQSISGNKIIWIDGKEMKLPSLGKHRIAPEGLSAMISRTHNIKMPDEVSISAPGMSNDVKAAMISAVEGVLMSYNIKKKVSVKENNLGLLHLIKEGSPHSPDTNFTFEINTDHTDMKVNKMFIIDSKSDGENEQVIHIETKDN